LAGTAIHTAVPLFAIMHFAANKFTASTRMNSLALCLTGVLIATAIGPFREVILGAVGDRRAEYYDVSSTAAYLSFWIVMWVLLLYRWKDTMTSIDARYALIILSIVAMNVFTGGYSSRFIAAAFPSLVITMSHWRSKPFSLITLLFVPYASLQWVYWLIQA
jgi:hypothetical protein